MAKQDPIEAALRRCRKVEHMMRGDIEDPPSDEELRSVRAACSALLKLSPEERSKVLAAARALG